MSAGADGEPPGAHFGSAHFEHPPGGVHVTVAPNTLNINASNLSALERLAKHSPEVASKLIEAAKETDTQQTKRYAIGAICTAVVAAVMLISTATVIIVQGFWAGIAFFLVCAAVSAIIGAFYTGKSESLSWTIGFAKAFGHPPE